MIKGGNAYLLVIIDYAIIDAVEGEGWLSRIGLRGWFSEGRTEGSSVGYAI